MLARRAVYALLVIFVMEGTQADTRYFVKMRTNASELFKTKNDSPRALQDPIAITQSPINEDTKTDSRDEDERMIRDTLKTQFDRRNSFIETSTFNPDVLNKFLEEYASKIKSTTEKDFKFHPFRIVKPTADALVLEVDDETTRAPVTIQEESIKEATAAENSTVSDELADVLNDTLKRNKYYGANSHDDRNGWVTLDAIPWSKSKISKWQANPSTQRPWPEIKPWEKPSMTKPWQSDYLIRPTNYENNKPWYDNKPKPHWTEPTNEKPWTKPPPSSSRPSYYPDKYDDASNQAQKWPPERPTWDKYTIRPSDIITDDRPSNFPNNNWNKPSAAKPSYGFSDRYSDKVPGDNDGGNDWHDYPTRFDQTNGGRPRPSNSRPPFSHYQYQMNSHPPTHPSNGDGQWVLLSTNRGYSKSRQRSIKLDAVNPEALIRPANRTKTKISKGNGEDANVPVMTSKRQVRLTVLPSINGTNTTTSHGGLLEVEKTFKSVEQSRQEYELERMTTLPTILKRRPIRNTLNGKPSSSAVLAAVGAGMLPATMAMMIPMMLGRRRREIRAIQRTLPKSKYLVTELHDLASRLDARRTRYAPL